MAIGTQRLRRGEGTVWGARLAWLLLYGLAAIGAFADGAEAQKPSRDDVEAAYLYNFGKFVRWPESAGHTPMLVCVLGQDSLGQTISKLVEGEQINGRPLVERNLNRPDGVGDCSILFIGSTERARVVETLTATEGKPILTVGDAPDFLEQGGMIEFVQVEDHVRFSVNLDECTRHRVAVSSELLKVAVTIRGKRETGGVK